MLKSENLDFAIERTLEKHPDFIPHMNAILLSQITDQINLIRFTRDGGARDLIADMQSDDVLRYVLHESTKIYNAATFFYYNDKKICSLPSDSEKIRYLLEVFPCFGELQNMMSILTNRDVNTSLYLKGNKNDLLCLINSVLSTRFNTGIPYKDYVDRYGRGYTVNQNGESIDLFTKIDEDIKKAEIAQRLNVNHRAINKCLGDLMSGVQLKNKRNEYVLEGNLYVTQDIGNRRPNQEDSTIILTHPENQEFKFLAVSDGMGGVEYGDKASTYTIQKITEWFNSLPVDFYYYPNELQAEFNKRIAEISEEVYHLFNADFNRIKAGATFVGAIVTSEKTVVSSVGDSRAYVTRGPSLDLITRDESAIWPPGYNPENMSKEQLDEMRFNRKNNMITRCIGQERTGIIQSHILDNASYDRLMLFSDGVTDLLSTDRIRFLALNTPAEQLTSQLVNEALLYDAVRLRGESEEYAAKVAAGKDNATAAAYIRR